MIEDVQIGAAARAARHAAPWIAIAHRDAPRKRPALQFQRRQRQLSPQFVQDQRLLADARALAFPDLEREARTHALLDPQNLEA